MLFVDKKNIQKEHIVVLVSSWRAPQFLYNRIKKSIPKNYGYIHYWYSDEILNDNPALTKKYFLRVIQRIISDLKKLKKAKRRVFCMYGQSLGGLFCAAAGDSVGAKKLMLVVPGANLAEAVWHGSSTKKIRHSMDKEGMTLRKLKYLWRDISPDCFFNGENRTAHVTVVLSSRDRVIPTYLGKQLIALIKKQEIQLDVRETALYHSPACIREALVTRNFKKWLLE